MNFEQSFNNEDNEKEVSQEELAEIGDRVLGNIKTIEETIEKLEKEKEDISNNNEKENDPKSNSRLQYIENILPAFYAKIEFLKDLAGQE